MKFSGFPMLPRLIGETFESTLVADRWLSFCLFAVVVAFALAGTRYVGITHDAWYYGVEALRRVSPVSFSRDPFFLGGSQGDFSLFIAPYAQLISALGQDQAAFIVTLTGRLLWLAGLAWFAAAAIGARHAGLAAFVVLFQDTEYGTFHLLFYFEQFATPRLFAEALALFSFGFALRRWWGAAFGAIAMAITMHPLMALPPAMMIGALFIAGAADTPTSIQLRRMVMVVIAGATAVLILALAGITPFNRLLQSYDDEWFQVIVHRSPLVLLQEWSVDTFSTFAITLISLSMAMLRTNDARMRQFLRVTLFVTIFCALLWIVASVSRDILVLQLQTWRVQWCAKIIAAIAWTSFVGNKDAASFPARMQVLFMLLAHFMGGASGLAIALVAAVMHWLSPELMQRRSLRAALSAFASLLVLLVVFEDISLAVDNQMFRLPTDEPFPFFELLGNSGFATFVALAMLAFFVRNRMTRFLVAAGVLSGSLAIWCGAGFAHAVADDHARARELDRYLPTDSVIYWTDGVVKTWFDAHRSNYASYRQMAGCMFSRESALELQRRNDRLYSRNLPEGKPAKKVDVTYRTEMTDDDVSFLCADPALDHVIDGFNTTSGGERIWLAGARRWVTVHQCISRR